ncbi:hypothetical protein [Bacillus massilinigeriensis]|uniref:hypothetical protein n=1 Tax=Bacillus mediterraneensis TaxID=1805474 RepID=UPI0008F937C4|nr:hypothetical protein [Bacillus mediterraneensis]
MVEINKNHDFFPYEDLSGKASPFKRELDRMMEAAEEMSKLIESELKTSHGETVETIKTELEGNQKKFKGILHDHHSLMTTLADRYSYRVNEMRTQNITIHYEEKEASIKENV